MANPKDYYSNSPKAKTNEQKILIELSKELRARERQEQKQEQPSLKAYISC